MEKRLFDVDPFTGATQYFYHDEETDETVIETVQNVDLILEANKDSFNSIDEKARWGDGKMIARIPLNLYYDLKQKGVVDDEAAFRRWLNDSENRFFRTRPGKV